MGVGECRVGQDKEQRWQLCCSSSCWAGKRNRKDNGAWATHPPSELVREERGDSGAAAQLVLWPVAGHGRGKE